MEEYSASQINFKQTMTKNFNASVAIDEVLFRNCEPAQLPCDEEFVFNCPSGVSTIPS